MLLSYLSIWKGTHKQDPSTSLLYIHDWNVEGHRGYLACRIVETPREICSPIVETQREIFSPIVKTPREICSHIVETPREIWISSRVIDQASAARVNYSPTRERVFILQTVH
jgi:hypothetical protein